MLKSIISALFGLALIVPAVAKPVPTTCGATDLMKAMAKAEPETHQKIIAAARLIPNGDGLLWRVE